MRPNSIAWAAGKIVHRAALVPGIGGRGVFFRRTITGASVGKRNVNAFPVNVEVVEVQQVPVGATDVSAIT